MNHIFIESGKRGSNEFNFIKDIVFAACKQNLDEHYDIVNVNGFTSLPDFRSKFLEHKSPEEKNLVIFDADYPETNGGFEARTKSIRQYGEKLSIDFELFLFPNNNADGIFANKSLKKTHLSLRTKKPKFIRTFSLLSDPGMNRKFLNEATGTFLTRCIGIWSQII